VVCYLLTVTCWLSRDLRLCYYGLADDIVVKIDVKKGCRCFYVIGKECYRTVDRSVI
jgi:hypothetical protein